MSLADYNISSVLTEVAAVQPQKQAITAKIRGRFKNFTFREVEVTADSYAAALASAGIKPGERVMLMVKPSLDFVCLTFALFRIGAVVILIDPGMGYKNLLKCISSVSPKLLIGIPQAQLFKKLFPKAFSSIDSDICVGFSFLGLLGKPLAALVAEAGPSRKNGPKFVAQKDDLAAIIFTTGSTGPPKGVQYTHGVFRAQLKLIRDYYKITANDIDQPAFPLFALFTTAMGACAVIPDMNPAHPAKVDPGRFVASINTFKVSYSFGSPAIWNVVSQYCLNKKITLPSLKKVLMAGAPVSGELIERVKKILPQDAEIHTPYGATESLPVASITGSEVIHQTWPMTRVGKGTCVGRPLPGVEMRIIEVVEGPISSWKDVNILADGEIGEIVVMGEIVTHAYDHNDTETKLAKIADIDSGKFWHRIGDVGYFDDQNRLWFCGRKAHRVVIADHIYHTIPCEAIFNEHPLVYRSAIVGVELPSGKRVPVVIVEPGRKIAATDLLIAELQKIAKDNTLTAEIAHFLIHPAFPVDIRHNAKIFREKLAVWAADELAGT